MQELVGKVDSAGSRVVTLRTQVTLSHCHIVNSGVVKIRCEISVDYKVGFRRGPVCSCTAPGAKTSQSGKPTPSRKSRWLLSIPCFHFLPYGQKISIESRLWMHKMYFVH